MLLQIHLIHDHFVRAGNGFISATYPPGYGSEVKGVILMTLSFKSVVPKVCFVNPQRSASSYQGILGWSYIFLVNNLNIKMLFHFSAMISLFANIVIFCNLMVRFQKIFDGMCTF